MKTIGLGLLALVLLAAPARADEPWFAPADEWNEARSPRKYPYTCTFHWFEGTQASGERATFGLDLIRSDDTGRMGLRVFVKGADGTFRRLVVEAPASEWAPFSTTGEVDGGKLDAIGRGPGLVSASVRAPGQDVSSARFRLEIRPQAKPRRLGMAGGPLVDLSALDYTEVHTSGFIEVQLAGEAAPRRFEMDRARGPQSIHIGKRLPEYGYVASIPSASAPGQRDSILLSAVNGDAIAGDPKIDPLLGSAFTYAFGMVDGKAKTWVAKNRPGENKVAFADGTTLELLDVKRSDHALLGVPTTTGTARARLTTKRLKWAFPFPRFETVTREFDVIFDLRGSSLIDAFAGKGTPATTTATPGIVGGLGD